MGQILMRSAVGAQFSIHVRHEPACAKPLYDRR